MGSERRTAGDRQAATTTIVGGQPNQSTDAAGLPAGRIRMETGDITLINLNMLYVRYQGGVERELHVPLGPLYLTRVLQDAGYSIDFRDYQCCDAEDPFDCDALCSFLDDSAPLIGVSVMANLLPFALWALRVFKERNPDKTVVLGGVGPRAVERTILERFPWIDAVAYGEGERMVTPMVRAFQKGIGFATVPGMYYRDDEGAIRCNAPPPRIQDLDTLPFPAWEHIELGRYQGYGLMTSRGCPYPCTFCSAAPIWDHHTTGRSNASILAEMRALNERAGVELFLFQDEFFVSSPARVNSFCDALRASGMKVSWKAFGRVNLADSDMMRRMADTGCVELRFGIESGSDRVLARTKKGFTAKQATEIIAEAVSVFDRVDAFYMWGFPFETMEDFYQTVFQMLSLRMLGARILPSLLCYLPQTQIFAEFCDNGAALEFCRDLFPEYMVTGHEIYSDAHVTIAPEHAHLFDFVAAHPDLFPGFFHWDLEGNVRPKLAVLQEMGFYPGGAEEPPESCGAHSPRVAQVTSGGVGS